jgi:hypothetical protein
MPRTVLAVIGGYAYDNNYVSNCMDSLRLFDCPSAADAYAKHLTEVEGYDYALCHPKEMDFTSALATA